MHVSSLSLSYSTSIIYWILQINVLFRIFIVISSLSSYHNSRPQTHVWKKKKKKTSINFHNQPNSWDHILQDHQKLNISQLGNPLLILPRFTSKFLRDDLMSRYHLSCSHAGLRCTTMPSISWSWVLWGWCLVTFIF